MSFREHKCNAQGHLAEHEAKIRTMKGTLERQDHRLSDWELRECSGWVCMATPRVGTQERGLQSHASVLGPRMFALWIERGSGQGMSGFQSPDLLPHRTEMVSFL